LEALVPPLTILMRLFSEAILSCAVVFCSIMRFAHRIDKRFYSLSSFLTLISNPLKIGRSILMFLFSVLVDAMR